MKIRILVGLGILHLILVSLGAAQIDISGDSTFFRILRYYGALSGSNANYSFFAPAVGSPLRASFYISDKRGNTVVEGTDTADRELSLRYGNIVDGFRIKLREKDVRRSIAASWAGLVLARYPEAARIRFVLDEYHIPTMKEFNDGAKAHWLEDYSAEFKVPEKKRDSK